MKKFISIAVISLFVSPAAFAQDFGEFNIGVGWDNGYSVKTFVEPVSIQLTGKFDSVIPENDDLDTETDAEIAAYVAYPFMNFDKSKLNVFGGFGLMPTTRGITVGSITYDKKLDFAIRLGIEPEVMVTDHIGLSAKAGLQVQLNQGYDGLDNSGETDVGTWGSVGVHWYF
jgi:hypothetical protein